MDEIERLFHDLSLIAPSMESLEKRENAHMFYDVLSGSIVWSDELPGASPVSSDCLRFVLKYRTGLLVGEPEPSFEPFWQEAHRRFPHWIGFSPDRTTYDQKFSIYYNREKRRAVGDREGEPQRRPNRIGETRGRSPS
jgi:hypothetical protein